MADQRSAHLSEEELSRLQDGELPRAEASHVAQCAQCSSRLEDLRSGAAAYALYRDFVQPRATPAPRPWPTLHALIAQNEARASARARRWWWAAPAAATVLGVMLVAWLRGPTQHSAEITDLLSRSAAVALPEERMISLRVGGRTFIRPAVLRSGPMEDAHLANWAARFKEADYSWAEPLSARSYQLWRNGLRSKSDAVSVIQRRGQTEAYRVRTDSPAGLLRSASLTLSANDLRPTHGAFQFAGEALLEMGEAEPSSSAPAPPVRTVRPPTATERPTEAQATPEDTLHVLAALNRIGADVGEPVEVSEDPEQRRLVVRARGISAERRREITEALKDLPRVVKDFTPAGPEPRLTDSAEAEVSSNDLPVSVRRRLEDQLGGVIALQEITDRVLEESGTLVSRAHALGTLAAKFPPETEKGLSVNARELLHTLRGRHVAELKRLQQRVRADLEPILPGASPAPDIAAKSWQSGAADLLLIARHTDRLLHRVLAGSYSQSLGEEMWRALRPQLLQLEGIIRLQEDAER